MTVFAGRVRLPEIYRIILLHENAAGSSGSAVRGRDPDVYAAPQTGRYCVA